MGEGFGAGHRFRGRRAWGKEEGLKLLGNLEGGYLRLKVAGGFSVRASAILYGLVGVKLEMRPTEPRYLFLIACMDLKPIL